MAHEKTLGVTVLGDYILNEGPGDLLDNLQRRTAVTAVACNPTVTCPAPQGEGSYQPPIDAGSSPRIFDRPLWGKHALWVKSAPSFTPNQKLYATSRYGPRRKTAITDEHGKVIAEFIAQAHQRGIKVFFQLAAAEPTGLTDEDRPKLPNGKLPERMADTASLASEHVREYNRVYVKDLLDHYPDIDGFRIDWPEYPCYRFEEIFQDFGMPVRQWSESNGFDFEQIRAGVQGFVDALANSPDNDFVDLLGSSEGALTLLLSGVLSNKSVREWLRLKAALSEDIVRHWRQIIDDSGGESKSLHAHAFMPPYNLITGMDLAAALRWSDAVSPKFYTMHWSLMVEFWGRRLLELNPGWDERRLVKALVTLMDIGGDLPTDSLLTDYGYPKPDEPHPIPNAPQQRKLRQVALLAGRPQAVIPLVHGYGPHNDFRRRFELVAQAALGGVWINRYGYLSDEKLDTIGRIWAATT